VAITKEERKSIGLSALASVVAMCAVLGPVSWYVVKPLLVASVSTAMAEDLDETIDNKLMPLNAGFKAILQSNINGIRRQIAALEYHREQFEDDWTAVDAQQLAQLYIDLDAQQSALRAVRSAENH